MEKNRIVYLDMIRIVSCILVVLVHVSAYGVNCYDVYSMDFCVANLFHILSFSGVSLFVMISGALALRQDKETDLKDLLLKKTIYFFLLYYFWKFVYQIVIMLEEGMVFIPENIKEELILALVKQRGYYHLWYLPMIAILYMVVPLIKKSMADKAICKYFICMFFVTALLFPTLFLYEFKFKYIFVSFFDFNDFSFFGGYLGYFIMGHLLHNWREEITPLIRSIILGIGILGFVVACVLGTKASIDAGTPVFSMQTPFVVTNFFTSVALFCGLQMLGGKVSNDEKTTRVLKNISGLTLGIYLLHPLILNLYLKLRQGIFRCNPIWEIPLALICTVTVPAVFVAILKKIPFVRKIV